MIGAIIGAGASLLGSLFGKKKAKQPETTTQVVKNEVDYQQMVESAEAAGFNPLTALRNGGSAGFGSGTTTTTHPGLSGNADVATSLGQFAGAIGDYFDPMARKQRQVESALMDYQLSTIQSKPKANMMFGDVPTKAGSGFVVQNKAPLSSGAKTAPVVSSRLLSSAASGTGAWLDRPKASQSDMPIWIAGKDRDGKRVWIPNPDGPDAEQLAFAALTRSQAGYENAADSLMNWRQHVAVRKLTDAEKKKVDESWLPNWVPRFKLSW